MLSVHFCTKQSKSLEALKME